MSNAFNAHVTPVFNIDPQVTGVPVELPYTHAAPMNVLITRTNTSLDEDGITITTNRGVIIRWSKKNDIEVSAPKTFAGALCGLCGNMNGNRKDDRTTRQFLPSRSAMEFAHSWKVDGYKHCSVAKIRGKTRQKFGSISINNIPVCAGKSFFVLKDIRKKCSLLRQRSFQVDINLIVCFCPAAYPIWGAKLSPGVRFRSRYQ